MVDQFFSNNYKEIITMAKKICKSHIESEEVAHYVMSEFLERNDAEDLIKRGEAMKFMSGMIHLSFHSSTSPYHTKYRQKGRVFGLKDNFDHADDDIYDLQQDMLVEAIQGVLEDMQADNIELWYRSTLFRMWLKEPNFSEISRQTGIPRTSISQAVEECKKYIKRILNERGINYDY
jgi:DNA-binding phage protein